MRIRSMWLFLGDRVALLGAGRLIAVRDVPRPRERAAHDDRARIALRRDLVSAFVRALPPRTLRLSARASSTSWVTKTTVAPVPRSTSTFLGEFHRLDVGFAFKKGSVDRLDFEVLDRPLDGLAFPTPEAFQDHLRDHTARDVARREDPAFSADLGAFLALLSVYGQLPRLVAAGRLTAHSVAEQLDGWWHGFFSFLASGPPGFRLRQLLALSRAGVVRFLGAGIRIDTDESTGTFTATGPTVPGHTLHATALVEAYLPGPSLSHTEDPLLRSLYREGTVAEEVIADPIHTHRSGLLAVSP